MSFNSKKFIERISNYLFLFKRFLALIEINKISKQKIHVVQIFLVDIMCLPFDK
jgi:hypothetical protein